MFTLVLALPRRLKWIIGVYLVVGISESFSWRWAYTVFQRIIDTIPGAHGFADIAPLFWMYAAIKAGQYVLIYLEVWPGTVLSTGTYQRAKLTAMRKVARVDYLAWQKLGTGGLVQTIENGADATRGVVTGWWIHLLRTVIPEIAISLFLLWRYDHVTAWCVAAGG